MRIEHIIYLSSEENRRLIEECNAHNKFELKDYLKKKFNMQTDFCVRVEGETYNILTIDYDKESR